MSLLLLLLLLRSSSIILSVSFRHTRDPAVGTDKTDTAVCLPPTMTERRERKSLLFSSHKF